MEKGQGELTSYWTSEYNQYVHFIKHGKQMGYFKLSDYSRAAVKFLFSNSASKLVHKSDKGPTYMYDTETNEFMMLNDKDKIVTYFPPTGGIDYFYSQF